MQTEQKDTSARERGADLDKTRNRLSASILKAPVDSRVEHVDNLLDLHQSKQRRGRAENEKTGGRDGARVGIAQRGIKARGGNAATRCCQQIVAREDRSKQGKNKQ